MATRRKVATADDLRNILRENWTVPRNPFDEVYGGIYIGDASTATNVDLLRRLGVTHILNAAVGTDWIRYVDTSPEYYSERKLYCEFYGIPAMDIMNYQLHPFFDASNEFIEGALEKNGKVLVHCREGISRSATLVIAFLMMKRNMTASEAVKLVRSKRQVFPNEGFLQQLCDLDIRLNKA